MMEQNKMIKKLVVIMWIKNMKERNMFSTTIKFSFTVAESIYK